MDDNAQETAVGATPPHASSAEGHSTKTDAQLANSATQPAAKKTARKKSVPPHNKKGTKKAPGKQVAKRANPNDGRKAGNNRKYDYDNARAQYVEGVPEDPAKPDGNRTWLSLIEVSERTGIPYQRIRERSSKDRWTETRTNYQASLAKKRHEERAKKIVHEAVEFDDKSLDVAKMGVRLIAQRMVEISTDVRDGHEKRKIIKAKLDAGIAVEKWEWKWLNTQINSAELERLAKAQSMFQEIGMRSLGTDVARHEISGPGGSPIGVEVEHTINVARELQRDDPDRLGAFFAAAHRAGVFEQLAELEADDDDDDYEPTEDEIAAQEEAEIYDAEIVE